MAKYSFKCSTCVWGTFREGKWFCIFPKCAKDKFKKAIYGDKVGD